MAKYSGTLGFAETYPDPLSVGVWKERIVEKPAKGDVLSTTAKWQDGEKINGDRLITNRISIVADPYALNHFSSLRYITWMGVKWAVSSITVKYPRLILSIGGEYNEEQTDSA